ncbi:hypothetical protein D022_2877A, partial [Vibrio parahaemolyticus 12310]
MEQEPRSNPD